MCDGNCNSCSQKTQRCRLSTTDIQPIFKYHMEKIMCARARPSDCASLTALLPNSMHHHAVHDFCPRTFIFHPCRLHAGPQMPSMSNTSRHGQLAPLAVRKTADQGRLCQPLSARQQRVGCSMFVHRATPEWHPIATPRDTTWRNARRARAHVRDDVPNV